VAHPSGLSALSVLNTASAARVTVLTGYLALDRALDLDRDLDRALDRALVRALAVALARNLDRACDFDLELDRALELDLTLAMNRVRARDLDLARARDLDRVLDRAHGLAHGLARDFVLARPIDYDFALLALARDLALYSELAGNRAFGLFPARYEDMVSVLHAAGLARAGPGRGVEMTAVREAVMGSGFASALLAAAKVWHRQGQPRSRDEVATAFIHALAASLGPDDRTFPIDLDALAATLREACELIRSAEGCAPWASYLAGQLLAAAEPIFTRRTPVTSDDATFIRLGAMALAAEPTGVARDKLYTIAAGVTLLQRRATEDKGTESIVLARG